MSTSTGIKYYLNGTRYWTLGHLHTHYDLRKWEPKISRVFIHGRTGTCFELLKQNRTFLPHIAINSSSKPL